jgi:hypothetical protein
VEIEQKRSPPLTARCSRSASGSRSLDLKLLRKQESTKQDPS